MTGIKGYNIARGKTNQEKVHESIIGEVRTMYDSVPDEVLLDSSDHFLHFLLHKLNQTSQLQ